MADDKTIVVKVDIDTEKVTRKLADAIKSVEYLKNEQKELNDQFNAGKISGKEYAAALADNKKQLDLAQRAVKSHTAALQIESETINTATMSLDEQRSKLASLQKAYAALDGDARAVADVSGGLRDKIKELTDSIKEQEHAIGDDRRNVGNYTESIKKAMGFSKEFVNGLKDSGAVSKEAADGLGKLGKVADAFTKHPILGIVQLLWQALSGNKEAMAALQGLVSKMMASLKQIEPLLNTVTKVLIDGVMYAIKGIMSGIKWILEKLDKMGKAFGKDWKLAEGFENLKNEVLETADAMKDVDKDALKAAEKLAKEREEQYERYMEQLEEMDKRKRTSLEQEVYELEQAMQKELEIVGLTEEEKQEIRDYYAGMIAKARNDNAAKIDEEVKKAEEEEQKKFEARKKVLEDAGLWKKDAEAEEQELLKAALDQQLITHEEYEAAKTLISEKYSKKRQEDVEKEVDKATKEYEKASKSAATSAGAALGALSSLLGEYADESEEAAKAQKAFGLGAILINQAMSIAEGAKGIAAAAAGAAEAAAATGPAAPIMLPIFTAQMVGEALAMVASVASTIVQSKQLFSQANNAGKFEQGGIVGGTSYTGDNLTANVNSAEMILTRKQQSRLFDIANGGAAGYNYELMAAAMATAVAQMPAPSLAITELAEEQTRVTTYNEIASI